MTRTTALAVLPEVRRAAVLRPFDHMTDPGKAHKYYISSLDATNQGHARRPRPGLERGGPTSIFELLNGYEPSVELRQSSSIPDPIPLLALVHPPL